MRIMQPYYFQRFMVLTTRYYYFLIIIIEQLIWLVQSLTFINNSLLNNK
jgi:hypothetical protein